MHFGAIFTIFKENGRIAKHFKLALKTTYQIVFLKYQANTHAQGLLHYVCPPRLDYRASFTKTNSRNSVENHRIGKKFKLVLKTTYTFLNIPAQYKVSFIVFGLCECLDFRRQK